MFLAESKGRTGTQRLHWDLFTFNPDSYSDFSFFNLNISIFSCPYQPNNLLLPQDSVQAKWESSAFSVCIGPLNWFFIFEWKNSLPKLISGWGFGSHMKGAAQCTQLGSMSSSQRNFGQGTENLSDVPWIFKSRSQRKFFWNCKFPGSTKEQCAFSQLVCGQNKSFLWNNKFSRRFLHTGLQRRKHQNENMHILGTGHWGILKRLHPVFQQW